MCCHILRWVNTKSGGMDINWSMGTTVVLGNPLSKTLSLYIDTPFFSWQFLGMIWIYNMNDDKSVDFLGCRWRILLFERNMSSCLVEFPEKSLSGCQRLIPREVWRGVESCSNGQALPWTALRHSCVNISDPSPAEIGPAVLYHLGRSACWAAFFGVFFYCDGLYQCVSLLLLLLLIRCFFAVSDGDMH